MDERARIIELAKNGIITTEEAISLLEALSKESAPQSELQVNKSETVPTQTVEQVKSTPKQEQSEPHGKASFDEQQEEQEQKN
jgi:hypothetical protein